MKIHKSDSQGLTVHFSWREVRMLRRSLTSAHDRFKKLHYFKADHSFSIMALRLLNMVRPQQTSVPSRPSPPTP